MSETLTGKGQRHMDRKLLSWVNDRNAEGIKPLEIAAAVAREAAKQKGLPLDGNQPNLLNIGTVHAPKETKYKREKSYSRAWRKCWSN